MSDIYSEQPEQFDMVGSDPSKDEDMGDEPEHGEMDMGDLQYCNECHEWRYFEEHTDINPDTHKVQTVKLCPCGAESEEV
jgi:hypothetical protein